MTTDTWRDGDRYESYVGRWSRPVAREFVRWLDVPVDARWIDVGCGTGALSSIVLADGRPRSIVGVDPSDGFIEHARRAIDDPRFSAEVGDAQDLPMDDGVADAVVSGLVLNFVPDGARAAGQMARVARPAATVAAYVWDYAGEMQLMRRFWDAARALDPGAAEADEGARFPLCRPEPLADLWRRAGLTAVETRAIDVPTVFRNFDDYWTPFLSGQAPAPRYCMSLDEPARAALRERLRATLPTEPDGSIHLVARAWAVRGRAPAGPSGA